MMSSSSTSRYTPRPSSFQCRCLVAALVACMLLSSLRPLPTLAQAPLDDGAVGGVELELAWQMGGAITALDVQGDYAYLGIGPRLVILDVSDPTHPVQVGRTEVLPSVETGAPEPYAQIWDIAVVDDTAYLAMVSVERALSLRLIDVSDRTDPQPANGLVLPDYGYPPDPDSVQLCWAGDKLVLGHSWESLNYYSTSLSLISVVDGEPHLEGSLAPRWITILSHIGSEDGRLHVIGHLDYYSESYWDIYQLPLASGDAPIASQCIGFTIFHGFGGRRMLFAEAGIALTTNDRLYRVEPEATVQPWDPALVPSCALSETDTRDATLALQSHYAVVVSESELMLVDLRDLLQPTVVGRVAVGGKYVDVAGDHAYVAGGSELHVVDISDPRQPQAMGAWGQPDWAAVSHLEVLSPDRLLVSVGSQLLVLDTPADAEPTIIGDLDVGAPINDFCLLQGEGCDLMLATDGLGLLPVGLDDEGLPFLDLYGPLQICDVNYVSIVQTSWEEEDYSGSPCTERRILALTDDHSLAMDVGTGYGEQCPTRRVSVCEGFSLEQVVGKYAYVGRSIPVDGSFDETGQIEVYDLSDEWHGPRVASVVATDRPVDSLITHDGFLYVGGVDGWCVGPTSSLLRVFDLSDPLAPEQVHGTVFGDCESTQVMSVSDDYLVASATCRICGSNYYGGAYVGSSTTIFRLNDGPELQLVHDMPCARHTTPLGISDDLLIATHPVYGLVAWRILPLPAWSAFQEGESCRTASSDYVPTPALPQTFGTDRHASGCEFVAGQLSWGVRLPHRGDYYLWARVHESDPDPGAFTLYTQISPFSPRGGATATFDGTPLAETWEWERVSKLDDPCPYTYSDEYEYGLEVSILMNHPSAAIDCLYLTDSPDAVPPMITPCVPAGLALLPMVMR